MKPSIVILPNEEVLDVPLFSEELGRTSSCHGESIKKFSDCYQLGITPESLGLPLGSYAGNRYQLALASLGHACICFDEEIWIFLPELLSKKQKEWFKDKKQFFKRHKKRLYYVVVNQERTIIEEMSYNSKGNHYKFLYTYIENSLEYQKRGREL